MSFQLLFGKLLTLSKHPVIYFAFRFSYIAYSWHILYLCLFTQWFSHLGLLEHEQCYVFLFCSALTCSIRQLISVEIHSRNHIL